MTASEFVVILQDYLEEAKKRKYDNFIVDFDLIRLVEDYTASAIASRDEYWADEIADIQDRVSDAFSF